MNMTSVHYGSTFNAYWLKTIGHAATTESIHAAISDSFQAATL